MEQLYPPVLICTGKIEEIKLSVTELESRLFSLLGEQEQIWDRIDLYYELDTDDELLLDALYRESVKVVGKMELLKDILNETKLCLSEEDKRRDTLLLKGGVV